MKRALVAGLFTVIIFLLPARCLAQAKVVIVTLTRAGLEQAAADQAMAPWLARGSVALMNISTAARSTSGHIYVTAGAGSRAVAAESAKLAFNADEEHAGTAVKDLFLRHLGEKPAGQVLHLGMTEIVGLNRTLQHPVSPGLLGDALRKGGKVTAVIGNADGQGLNREAAAILADSRGEIALGNVGKSILTRDDLFPFGWRIDRVKAWQLFREVYPVADVILVDWGDLARLDEYRPLLSDSVAAALTEEIFADVSWFLTRVFAGLAPEDILIILFPSPAPLNGSGGQLGMLAALGRPFPPGGLLSSATTRRPGIVAITDVAPFVLQQAGLPAPGGMLGRAISVVSLGGVPALLRMQDEIVRVFRLRPPLMKTYVFFQIVIVLGALLNLFVRIVPIRWFEGPLLGLLAFPLMVLYLPLHKISLVPGFVLTAAVVAAAVVILQRLLSDPVQRFAAVAAATSLSLVVDILRNAQLMKVSVLGYDAISGARYYGLGNEYMGVLVGTTVLAAAAVSSLLPQVRRMLLPLTALYFFAVVLIIVSPGGGANFGGTLTALIAFIVTLAVLGQVRPGWKSASAVLMGLVLFAGIAVFLNTRVPLSAQSHLGRTLSLVQQDGWQALRDVASRKAAMNVRLFRYSQWSRAFLVFLGMLTVLFFRPRAVLQDLHRLYPQLAAGFLGIIAGSITAFLVNDSGVVAAATTLLYAGVPIILLAARLLEKSLLNAQDDK
ncbi:MAG: hypothetical protein SCK29_01385 [Bacillota bacterium]|nr:hypothetical protein [Bacillota bacterium]MDW7682752.1 hypothetical protein [Bacillota bacterium]